MNNYDRALQLTATSADSAGLSDKRYAAYEESVAGKMKSAQAALESFVDSLLNSKLIGYFWDLITVVTKFFNAIQNATNGAAGWVAIVLSVVGVMKSLNSKNAAVTGLISLLSKLWKSFQSFGGVASLFDDAVTSVSGGIAGLKIKFEIATGTTFTFTAAVKALTSALLNNPLFVGFVAVTAVNAYVKSLSSLGTSFKDVSDKIDTFETKISSVNSEIAQLNSKDTLTSDEQSQLESLNNQLETLTKSYKEAKKAKYDLAVTTKNGKLDNFWSSDVKVGTSVAENNGIIGNTGYDGISSTQAATEATKKLTKARQEAETAAEEYNKAVIDGEDTESADFKKKDANQQKTKKNYDDLLSKCQDYFNELDTYGADAWNEEDTAVYNALKDTIDGFDDATSSIEGYASAYTEATNLCKNAEDANTQLNTSLENLSSSLSEVSFAFKEMSDDGHLSIDTVMTMIENNSDLLTSLRFVDGQYVIEQGTLESLFETKIAESIASIEASNAEMEAAIEKSQATIDANNLVIQSNGNLNDSIKANIVALLGEAQAASLFKSVRAGDTTVEDMTAQNAKLQAEIDAQTASVLKNNQKIAALSNMTLPSYSGAASDASAATKSLTDSLNDATDAAQDFLDTLNDEKDKQDAIAKAIKKILQNEIDALNDQKDAQDDVYDDKIQALQDQEDALEDQYDTEDKLLEIEKARKALEEAKNNKSVRNYSAQTGWYWGADASDVADKQSSLDDLMKEWNREQEKKAIEDAISELEKEKKAAEANIQAQIDALNKLKTGWDDATDTTMTDLNKWEGALDYVKQFESGNYDSRLSMMNSFTSNYVNLCNQIINAEKAVAAAKANASNASNATYSGTSSGGGSSSSGSSGSTNYTTRYGAWKKQRVYTVPGTSGYYATYTRTANQYNGNVLVKAGSDKKTVHYGSYSEAQNATSPGYATGGVDTKGGMAMLHGKPNAPEVIFNASQAKSLYNFVSDLSKAGGTTNNKTTSNNMTINMEVNAPNGSTFDSIINTAKQRITTTR